MSLFRTNIAIGDPSDLPSYTPESISTWSASFRCVVMALWPGRRRSSSCWIASASTASPGGRPSTSTPTAAPCDSPNVVTRNRRPNVEDTLPAPPALRAVGEFRAATLRAVGEFRSATLRAVGEFRSATLRAVGEFRSATLRALGEFRAALLRAPGELRAAALRALGEFRAAVRRALGEFLTATYCALREFRSAALRARGQRDVALAHAVRTRGRLLRRRDRALAIGLMVGHELLELEQVRGPDVGARVGDQCLDAIPRHDVL